MNHIDAPDFAPYAGCVGEWTQPRVFQSQSKTFGYFSCNFCQATWMSAHSRKGYKQGCKACDRYFYPLYLWKNDQGNYVKKEKSLEDNGKHHIRQLCQACKKGICEL